MRQLIGGAVGGIIAGVLFYELVYARRINSGDTESSVAMRAATDVVGFFLVLDHWRTGLGMGMN